MKILMVAVFAICTLLCGERLSSRIAQGADAKDKLITTFGRIRRANGGGHWQTDDLSGKPLPSTPDAKGKVITTFGKVKSAK